MSIVEFTRVTELNWDCLSGPEGHIENPDWLKIEDRIKALNPPEHSCVFISANNGTSLTIGGEPKQGFIVFFSQDDKHSYVMAPVGSRAGTQNLVIGYQPGDYPRRILVSLATAIQVARTYFLKAERDECFEWTYDDQSIDIE